LDRLSYEGDFKREKLDEYSEELQQCLLLFSDMEASNTSTGFHIPEFSLDTKTFMTVTQNMLSSFKSDVLVSRSAMIFLQVLVETVVCGKVVCLPNTMKPRGPLADLMTPSTCYFALGGNGISLRIMSCEIAFGEDDDADWEPDEEEQAVVDDSD
jgi:hypothetical protein